MNVARELFEQLKAGGMTELQRLVDEGCQEDLHIDFKILKNHRAPMTREDQQTLAEAISGFANSDGGVIVWGIEARKGHGEDKVDCARALKPIQGLRLLLSNLHEYATKQVSPAVDGVEHFLLPDPADADTGFALTLIPQYDGEPVMARAADQHRHYYRAGDSFQMMEPFMLSDRYSRRPRPILELTHRWERPFERLYLVLGIRNVGKGIALYPGIQIEERRSDGINVFELNDTLGAREDNRDYGLPERARTTGQRQSVAWRMFAGGSDYAIYPGTSIEVVRLLGWESPRQRANVNWKDFSFRYSLFCDGFSLTEATVTIRAEELADAAVKS